MMKPWNLMWTAFLLAAPNIGAATELYNGASTGMTEAQIRELFPAAVAADNEMPILPGATKALVLSESEQFGQHFRNEFYFSDAGLVQIVLVNDSLEKKRQIRKACTNLKSALVDEYGEATTSRVTKSMSGKSNHSIHEVDDLVVRLTCEAPFWPLRMSFQSRTWLDEQSPFGLSMGMSIEELLPYMEEPLPEEIEAPDGDDNTTDIVFEGPLSHVPNLPAGDGDLNFRVRASQRNGLCSVKATLSIEEDKGMEYLFSKANLMPNQDLFGTPVDIGGMFGEYKFSFFPTRTPMASSDMWVTTVEDKLPGSIDKMVYLWGSVQVDGVKTHVESLQIQFTNSPTCGLSRTDLEGFD